MNTLIHLEDWISYEGTNTIEIYLSKHIGQPKETHAVNITTDPETKQLLSKFGNGSFTKMKNYYHKDYVYTYDLSTDAQRIIKRTYVMDANPHARIYVVSFNENVLASHRFPTTDEINNSNIIERTTYRINNRLFVYNDKVYTNDLDSYDEYIYIHYNHSPQVDIKHMQLDIERVVRQLITPPSKSDPYQ